MALFHNLADARLKLAVYRRYYNQERPHSFLGYGRPPRVSPAFWVHSG